MYRVGLRGGTAWATDWRPLGPIRLPGNADDVELLENLESESRRAAAVVEFGHRVELDFAKIPHVLRRMRRAMLKGDGMVWFEVVAEPTGEGDGDAVGAEGKCEGIAIAMLDLAQIPPEVSDNRRRGTRAQRWRR